MSFTRKSNWTPDGILAMIQEGKSMAEIGESLGLSRQRIKQICQRHHLPSTVETRKTQRQERYFKKWGNERRFDDLYMVCREKLRRKKAAAKAAGIEWALDFGDIQWPTHCPILGLELDFFAEVTQENSPSFDRIDPSRGYVTGNVVVVSWRANRIKNDGSSQEHRLIAEYLDKVAEGLQPAATT